jgi:ankyrin repeat protein
VRVRRVNQLIDKGVPVDYEDADGVTALLAASVTGHIETISALVSRGANVDYETKLQAGTALIVACAAGKLAALGALVRHGANVDHETSSGMTALIVAAAKGQSKATPGGFALRLRSIDCFASLFTTVYAVILARWLLPRRHTSCTRCVGA